jgi:hypothetical protein
MKTLELILDANGHPTQVMQLNDPQVVDGTSASAQSTAIVARMVRIFAITGDTNDQIQFLIGDNPTALATSHPLSKGSDIYQPIMSGQKVAILGGKASIATAGV